MNHIQHLLSLSVAALLVTASVNASAQGQGPLTPRAAAVIEHWSADRMRQATPRDLLIDERGLGYLRQSNGYLQPYGHQVEAVQPTRKAVPSPFGKPGSGSSDTTPPTIGNLSPANGATIGSSATFSAKVTDDASGVARVDFKIGIQSFQASNVGNDTWQVNLQGFTDGNWSYQVVAKDGAAKGGNTATSEVINFVVDTGSGGGGGTGDSGGSGGGGGTDGQSTISEAAWDPDKKDSGAVTKAAGRIYFEMPANQSWRKWNGYVCSGTVATDGTAGRSIIITAAHCVYDDVNKAFARNVLFIPNQNATSGSGTDLNCSNDPMGCWIPSFGVVDTDWTTRTFPDNIPWDYAFYVVGDQGSHKTGFSTSTVSEALDTAAGSLTVQFATPPTDGAYTHALGYSYSKDPSLRYCAQNLAEEGSYHDWWLGACELSGGASGGPWVQPMDTQQGSGPIVSVNSWGYTTQPGMAGPKLSGNSARCRFADAITGNLSDLGSKADGQQGVIGTGTSCTP